MEHTKYYYDRKACKRNHAIVNMIISSVNEITGKTVSMEDISYLKYQLLQHDNSYELSSMNETEFKERLIEIIGA